MLSLEKSLCKILDWCITFIMFMNAHVNFTWFHLKVTSHVRLFISTPFVTIMFHNGGVFRVVLQHFLKSSPIPPQCVSLHGLYMDGEEFDDTWMFTHACQNFHQMLLTHFPLIDHLRCLPCQLNGVWDVEPFNSHLMHHTITTLIVSTW
jgi:hypothetical protein